MTKSKASKGTEKIQLKVSKNVSQGFFFTVTLISLILLLFCYKLHVTLRWSINKIIFCFTSREWILINNYNKSHNQASQDQYHQSFFAAWRGVTQHCSGSPSCLKWSFHNAQSPWCPESDGGCPQVPCSRNRLSSNKLHSQMEGNIYKRKSDGKWKRSRSVTLCNPMDWEAW